MLYLTWWSFWYDTLHKCSTRLDGPFRMTHWTNALLDLMAFFVWHTGQMLYLTWWSFWYDTLFVWHTGQMIHCPFGMTYWTNVLLWLEVTYQVILIKSGILAYHPPFILMVPIISMCVMTMTMIWQWQWHLLLMYIILVLFFASGLS